MILDSDRQHSVKVDFCPKRREPAELGARDGRPLRVFAVGPDSLPASLDHRVRRPHLAEPFVHAGDERAKERTE